jgi:CRP-like cAMP-binding protein
MPADRPIPPPTANRLLGALPADELAALRPQCEVVALGLKAPIYELYQPITQVYFPLTGVISLLARTGAHESVEISTIGSEGMVGLPVFLGATTAPTFAFAQVPGYSVRLTADAFRAEVAQRPTLPRLLLRYTQALFNQVAQGAACNRHHEVRQRLARWLLLMQDRAGADTFPVTHEFLAQMLGVRRASATEAAQALQAAQLIRYRRGMVTIVDRAGLEAAACACYQIITADFEALLPRLPPATQDPPAPWGTDTENGPAAASASDGS